MTRSSALQAMCELHMLDMGAEYVGADLQVDLACKILDGGPFRDDPSKVIMVQPAKFEMHGETYVPKKKKQKKKKKVVQEDKVLGWGGFDDILPPTQVRIAPEVITLTS